ncbi:MAG: hypothetical protein LH477_00545 [Nocardioides sp.]|nr:hypothetical protein [Nocardioides sp.]
MSATVKLRAGSLQADGTLSDGSMSRAIADALDVLVPPRPDEEPMARRKLALAIAQGVIGHLDANEGALMVAVPNTGAATVQTAVTVDVG